MLFVWFFLLFFPFCDDMKQSIGGGKNVKLPEQRFSFFNPAQTAMFWRYYI